MHLSSILALAALQSVLAYAQSDSDTINGGISGNGNSIGNTDPNCNGQSLNGYCCDGSIINPTGEDASSRNGDDDFSDLVCCEGDTNNNINLGTGGPTTCTAGTSKSLTKESASATGSSTGSSSRGTRTGMPANSTADPTATSSSDSSESSSEDSTSSSTSGSAAAATSDSSSSESTSSGDSGAAMITAFPVAGMLAGVGGAIVAAL